MVPGHMNLTTKRLYYTLTRQPQLQDLKNDSNVPLNSRNHFCYRSSLQLRKTTPQIEVEMDM